MWQLPTQRSTLRSTPRTHESYLTYLGSRLCNVRTTSKLSSEKKDSEATTARLKGNRFYKAKRWEKALELYMTSLKARPYAVNTLANVAQVGDYSAPFVRAGGNIGAKRRFILVELQENTKTLKISIWSVAIPILGLRRMHHPDRRCRESEVHQRICPWLYQMGVRTLLYVFAK